MKTFRKAVPFLLLALALPGCGNDIDVAATGGQTGDELTAAANTFGFRQLSFRADVDPDSAKLLNPPCKGDCDVMVRVTNQVTVPALPAGNVAFLRARIRHPQPATVYAMLAKNLTGDPSAMFDVQADAWWANQQSACPNGPNSTDTCPIKMAVKANNEVELSAYLGTITEATTWTFSAHDKSIDYFRPNSQQIADPSEIFDPQTYLLRDDLAQQGFKKIEGQVLSWEISVLAPAKGTEAVAMSINWSASEAEPVRAITPRGEQPISASVWMPLNTKLNRLDATIAISSSLAQAGAEQSAQRDLIFFLSHEPSHKSIRLHNDEAVWSPVTEGSIDGYRVQFSHLEKYLPQKQLTAGHWRLTTTWESERSAFSGALYGLQLGFNQ